MGFVDGYASMQVSHWRVLVSQRAAWLLALHTIIATGQDQMCRG